MLPERQHLIPSPAGLGLAWTFHWYYGVLFFLGGVLAWWVERRYPRWSEEFTFPVASGWIAGESLMGVTIVICGERPELLAACWADPKGDPRGGRGEVSQARRSVEAGPGRRRDVASAD